MGCNCKALNYVTHVKSKYGYNKPTKKNVSISNKLKMVLQALLIWIVLMITAPIFIVILIFSKIFKKDVKVFKKIKIRL